MDGVRESLSCFDVQHGSLRSVRDRYGRIRFHRTRRDLEKTDLERHKRRNMVDSSSEYFEPIK